MYVYQDEDDSEFGLNLVAVLDSNDMDQIVKHNPLCVNVGPLRLHISFCEPFKPVFFDDGKKVYFVSLGFREMRFLRGENSLVAIHMIEDVPFVLDILFRENTTNKPLTVSNAYMVLEGSTFL